MAKSTTKKLARRTTHPFDSEAPPTSADSDVENGADVDEEATEDVDAGEADPPGPPAPQGFVQQDYPNAPPGIVLGPKDPVFVRGMKQGPNIVLTEPVSRAFKPKTSKRWSFHQVFPKGAHVLASKVVLIEEVEESETTEVL